MHHNNSFCDTMIVNLNTKLIYPIGEFIKGNINIPIRCSIYGEALSTGGVGDPEKHRFVIYCPGPFDF